MTGRSGTAIKLFTVLICGWLTLALSAGGDELLMEYGSRTPVRYAGDVAGGSVRLPARYVPKKKEFRGIWIATIENIDFNSHADAASFKDEWNDALARIAAAGFTAVIFQVRPSNDAFYPSALNPWSHWLSGREGIGLDGGRFDPLAYMIATTHRKGLEFHAWLNPYRVSNAVPLDRKNFLRSLDAKNYARKYPEHVLAIPTGNGKFSYILNPGEPAVRQFLLRTVKELAEKYAVDAIHLDDYFYPYQDIGLLDAAAFRAYAKPRQSLGDWRRSNVDALILGIHRQLAEINLRTKRRIRFGVSPFGIWANKTLPVPPGKTPPPSRPEGSLTRGTQSYFKIYADTRRWVREGWIDYIAPQLYWPFSHRVAAYAALTDWWADTVKGTRVDLYIGHAAYRQGSAEWRNPDELTNQLRYNTLRPEIDGSIFFSYSRVFRPENNAQKTGAARLIKILWGGKYLPK